MKANVRHQQKAIFSIKKYLPLQSIWYLAVLKTLNTHDGVILTLSYPENIIFLKKIHFQLCPISLHTIKGVTYFKWKLTLSKTKHLSMSLLAYKEEGFSLFPLIEVASDTFQTFPGCYGLFPVVLLFTSDEVTEYFDL